MTVADLPLPEVVFPGDVVRTSYDSGPYIVERVVGPYPAIPYIESLDMTLDELEEAEQVAPLGWGLVCRSLVPHHGPGLFYLNDYATRGVRIVSMTSRDELFVVSRAAGRQLSMFQLNEGVQN